jgi:hypothetical protein
LRNTRRSVWIVGRNFHPPSALYRNAT